MGTLAVLFLGAIVWGFVADMRRGFQPSESKNVPAQSGSVSNTPPRRPAPKVSPPKIARAKKQISLDDIEITPEFQQALDLMEKTNQCLFITGKAGTGKSTLLRYFRAKTDKNVVVVAPTGIAAINVEGQTIHSFFKLPPRFVQKEDIRRLTRNRKVIECLDTLIVDEVSMVRADLMDGIDHALRLNRGKPEVPFGGVQVILFGDLFQLSPIVSRDMAEIFDRKYKSPYFFSSKVVQGIELTYLELTKIYRQNEVEFIGLLNKIRDKKYSGSDLSKLNERVVVVAEGSEEDEIVLTTTNQRASEINQGRLSPLGAKAFQYDASVTGKFDESVYPNDASLILKKGAQVMLIKNDPNKRWVNGTIGHIEGLSAHSVTVSIDGKSHDVPKSIWEKIEYVYNEETERVESKAIGTFEQYPIKLAWAITIHKSQGKTFEKVVVELGDGAFAHGQVYVALSRCTRFEGLKLKRAITARDIIFDDRILGFRSHGKSLAVEAEPVNE